jgi:hypothetical protein
VNDPTPDRPTERFEVEMLTQQVTQRRRIEQALAAPCTDEAAEAKIGDPVAGRPRERGHVGAKDPVRLERGPHVDERACRLSEVVGA